MNRDDKVQAVEELKETLVQAPSVVLAATTGIPVNTVNELRSELRAKGITYKVVKNTLAKRAIAGTDMEALDDQFRGPTAVVFHPEEPGLAAKVLLDFQKKNEKFQLKAGYADGQVLDDAGLEMLSKLPGKDDLRAKVIGLMTAVPTKVVRVFTAAQRDIVGLLNARRDDIDG